MTSKSSHLPKKGAAGSATKRLTRAGSTPIDNLEELEARLNELLGNDETVAAAIEQQHPGFMALDLAAPSPEDAFVFFGSVMVRGSGPAPETIERNIASSRSALKRGLTALIKPGVKLPRSEGIPIYRADPNDPTILIRELNGRDERGMLVDGEFKIAK